MKKILDKLHEIYSDFEATSLAFYERKDASSRLRPVLAFLHANLSSWAALNEGLGGGANCRRHTMWKNQDRLNESSDITELVRWGQEKIPALLDYLEECSKSTSSGRLLGVRYHETTDVLLSSTRPRIYRLDLSLSLPLVDLKALPASPRFIPMQTLRQPVPGSFGISNPRNNDEGVSRPIGSL